MASAAWERRNERARAAGFRNYYEYRTRRIPGAPKPPKEELRRRRGHSGEKPLERLIRSGRVELVSVVQIGYGDPPRFDVTVILKDGTQRSYFVRGSAGVRAVKGAIDDQGGDAPQIVGSPKALRAFTGADEDTSYENAEEQAAILEEYGDDDAPIEAPDDSDIPF